MTKNRCFGSRREFLGATAGMTTIALSGSAAEKYNRSLPEPDELLTKSALELARLIRTGKMKSSDVVRAYLKRIDKLKEPINAVVQVNPLALKQAEHADASPPMGPLHGVPVSIKDQYDVQGLVTACGMAE